MKPITLLLQKCECGNTSLCNHKIAVLIQISHRSFRAGNASGTFSNGITTLQNYCAPQMNAHTMGKKITIVE